MKDELNSKILTGKQLNNTYLIRHHGYYEIKESIIPDIEAYDLFNEIKEKQLLIKQMIVKWFYIDNAQANSIIKLKEENI